MPLPRCPILLRALNGHPRCQSIPCGPPTSPKAKTVRLSDIRSCCTRNSAASQVWLSGPCLSRLTWLVTSLLHADSHPEQSMSGIIRSVDTYYALVETISWHWQPRGGVATLHGIWNILEITENRAVGYTPHRGCTRANERRLDQQATSTICSIHCKPQRGWEMSP